MSFSITYQSLVEVDILHNYFLDDGSMEFSSMSGDEQKNRLKRYEVATFIDIIPSQDTFTQLNNHHLVFKKTKTGFTVYSKIADGSTNTPFVELANDLKLTFLLKLSDRLFGNYTNLDLSAPGMFYFTNTKPATAGTGFKYISKSNEATLITNAHQISVDTIKNIYDGLKGQEKLGLFGLINLGMIGDSGDLNILTTHGKLRVQPQIFNIHFDNRETFWRYKNASDDSEVFTTNSANPLTKHGFIEIDHNGDKFPNPTANQIKRETNNFFSEIYI